MAVLDLNAMAEGIATTLKAEIDTDRINIYAHPEGIKETPYVVILPGDPFVQYQRTFTSDGMAEVRWEAVINAGIPAGDGDAYRLMYELLGQGSGETMSLFDALASDPTFAGTARASKALDVGRPVLNDDGALLASFPITAYQMRGNG